MLPQGRCILFLFVLLFAFSCNNKKQVDFVRETQICKAYSQKVATKPIYEKVYNAANDSIKRWCEKELSDCEYIRINRWRIDSLVCFSDDARKCIMALCKQSTFYKDQDADGIKFLYGVNIKGGWYFFLGAYIVIPREMYVSKDKLNEPLSFAKLHEIAMKEVFDGYLVKNAKGKWEINEEWFKQQLEGPGWGDFKDQESFDWFLKGKRFKTEKEYYEFLYLQKVRNNWYSAKPQKP